MDHPASDRPQAVSGDPGDGDLGRRPAPRHPSYPFEYEGATLIVEERGPGEKTFVLVHGIGMGRSVFGELTDHLARRGRVVAIDLPGYGDAPEPPRVLTMERTADLLAGLIRRRDFGPAVVVGHSMGAQVVIELAARHPDLTDRIVLIGPTVDDRERNAARQILRLMQDIAIESPKVIAVGAREYVHAGPNLRTKMKAMLVHEPEKTARRVKAEALVIRGENDLVARRDWCERLVDALPHGRLAQVAGHGHETMIRDAAPTARLILQFADHG